jgi:eukaryotic-like serine/threonine-protein kinase
MLSLGTRLGAYEILSALGAGGMGEVYRATDTNLGRQVAIKVLPDAFAQDPERVARFEREAKTLASLNHPNIAQIYGLEKSAGVQALVMELVEGPTLADRIASGPIPIDEALPIAKQIAEALEAAHEQGIIHRDLKPSNVKVRTDGTVKVLDFGLAKLAEPSAGAGTPPSPLSFSPTITSPAMTGVGVLLGTAAYMSPEQARGRAADKRSDVWAFGCVLYEMLVGKRPFDGEDVTDVLVAVLGKDPADLNALPADVPVAIRTLLRRCLEKDRRKRIGAISTARFVIDEAGALGTAASANEATVQPRIDAAVATVRRELAKRLNDEKQQPQEVLILLCARLDALASGSVPEGTSNKKAFSKFLISYAGRRSLFDGISVGDVYYEVGYHRWLIEGTIPKPGRLQKFSRIDDPILYLLAETRFVSCR